LLSDDYLHAARSTAAIQRPPPPHPSRFPEPGCSGCGSGCRGYSRLIRLAGRREGVTRLATRPAASAAPMDRRHCRPCQRPPQAAWQSCQHHQQQQQ